VRCVSAVPLAQGNIRSHLLIIAIDIRRISGFGVGTYIQNLVRTLARQDRRHRYVLVQGPHPSEAFSPLPENFTRVSFSPGDRSLRNHLQFQALLEEYRVDLLHVPHRHVPMLVPCPYVVTLHDLGELFYPASEAGGLRRGLRDFLMRRALAGAARVMVVSRATGRDVIRHFRLDASRIEVVYNAIDDRLTQPLSDAERLRTLERYDVNYPFLLYAGSVRPQKNVVRLIEAFAALKGEIAGEAVFSNLKLIVIGDEPSNNPDLRQAVVRSRMQQDVRFLGFVPMETLRVFYQAAEVFVFPTLYEDFGLPPLEAMALGTPVVASNTSSLPEVLGDAAVLVNPENVWDIVRGVHRVLVETGTREFLRRRGLEQARKFSWERSVERVLEIYDQVGARHS